MCGIQFEVCTVLFVYLSLYYNNIKYVYRYNKTVTETNLFINIYLNITSPSRRITVKLMVRFYRNLTW